MKDWHSINMRRKKVFIAIVILLVLGLGVVTEYQRRNRDIEFEIPGRLNSLTFDISNPYVVYQDQRDTLTLYNLRRKTRTLIQTGVPYVMPSICEPWIVWEETLDAKTILLGYDLRTSQRFPIRIDEFDPTFAAFGGDQVVWARDYGEITGYDLETKSRYPIRNGIPKSENVGLSSYLSNVIQCLDTDGDLAVWLRWDGKNDVIEGYDLRSHTQISILSPQSPIRNLRVSGQYLVWKESETSHGQPTAFSIMAYDRTTGEIITIVEQVRSARDFDVSEEVVVWDDTMDIYGYDLKARHPFSVCSEKGTQIAPRISGNSVIWNDNRPQRWIEKVLRKERCELRGKIFRHWPGEEK
jgi:hypothetical protein